MDLLSILIEIHQMTTLNTVSSIVNQEHKENINFMYMFYNRMLLVLPNNTMFYHQKVNVPI